MERETVLRAAVDLLCGNGPSMYPGAPTDKLPVVASGARAVRLDRKGEAITGSCPATRPP